MKMHRNSAILLTLLTLIGIPKLNAQISTTGCLEYNFGIDAGLFSNIIEFGLGSPAAGSKDWFFSSGTGLGVIDESDPAAIKTLLQAPGNPTYVRQMNTGISSLVNNQIMIDAVFARDHFGGTGGIDATAYSTASKNGEDPAIWDPGEQNVLGKNDLIDVAGHMFREGPELIDHLWFVGMINRAEPGGDAYMDFEFFIDKITYTPGSGFSSGGPQLGHTAFTFNASGDITKVGDFIFNMSLTGGGTTPNVEVRLWVSYADYAANRHPAGFTWGPDYDGAYTGSPYGYASIIPTTPEICGIVNTAGQNPAAPPWGTKGTKDNVWRTTYPDYSLVEIGLNMTHLGIDHATLLGAQPCNFPIHTFIVKTRASNSFTAQLKDFAGPFPWAQAKMSGVIIGGSLLSCQNSTVELTASPNRVDVEFEWTTVDGQIIGPNNVPTITAGKPGTYTLHSILPTGCPIDDAYVTVAYDPAKPLFGAISATSTVSCSGSDGTITLSVEGGTPPLTFDWDYNGLQDPDSDPQNPVGLAPGSYSVIVTDALGCTTSLSDVVVSARIPTVIEFSLSHVNCFGNSNGSIDATVTGNPPYIFSWSNGATTEDIAGLSAGTYTLTATDADGCREISSTVITQPAVLSLSLVKTDDTDPTIAGNGTIDLSVSGGTSPYTYDWSHNGAEDPDTDPQDLTGLIAGSYTVLVTDAHGCSATLSTTIFEPEICGDGIDNDGNGLADCLDIPCIPAAPGAIVPSDTPVCVGDTDVTYTVPNTSGYTYTWTVPAGANITGGTGTNQITVTWTANIGGQICVKAVTAAGCSSSTPTCFTVILNDVPPKPGTIIKGF